MNWQSYLYLALALWNLTVFFLYAMDKYRARQGAWRVPERALLLCALLGGGAGGFAGMFALRHKTRHLRFRILVPLALVLTLLLLFSVSIRFDFQSFLADAGFLFIASHGKAVLL